MSILERTKAERIQLAEDFRRELRYDSFTGEMFWRTPRPGRKMGQRAGHIKENRNTLYRMIGYNGAQYTSASVAWAISTGEYPEFVIDHVNGDTTDDSWGNLCRGDNAVVQRNQPLQYRNKTGIMGVRLNNGYWLVTIGFCGTQKYLGCTQDFFEACCIRKSAENKYGYSKFHGRRGKGNPANLKSRS